MRILSSRAVHTCGMNEPLEFTLAQPHDEQQIVALVRAAYLLYIERIGKEPAPMTADYGTAIAAGQVSVVRRADEADSPGEGADKNVGEQAGEILGLIVMEAMPDYLLVENIAVSPAAQGLGIGGLLLEHAYAEARSKGLAEVRLYTNAKMTENLSYYPRRGFIETGRRHEDGFDRVYFSRPSSSSNRHPIQAIGQ